VDDEPTFFLPEEIRTRAPNKKQGSNDDVHPKNNEVLLTMLKVCESAVDAYAVLLDQNVPPEQARMILPQCMMTEFIETASIAAYARLCKLRMGPDAQKEIQEVAGMVGHALATAFPVSWKVLLAHGESRDDQ
jgi:thymidylate synthase (FAD)